MNISLVPPDHVFTAWKEVREYLVPAVEVSNGRWTAEHLLAILHSVNLSCGLLTTRTERGAR